MRAGGQDRAPMRAPVVSGEGASVYRSAWHPGPAHNDHGMAMQSGQVKTVRDVSALGFCQDLGNGEIRLLLAPSWLLTGCQQLVCGVDHDRPAVLGTDPAGEPEPRPAINACDMRAAVEQRGQMAGRILDFVGEHGVVLGGADPGVVSRVR
jgi:hypothetical protein